MRIRDILTKEVLEDLYHNQDLTTYEIGDKYNCSAGYVQNLIKQYGIARKLLVEEKIDRDTLYELYHNQRLSCVKIGKLYGHKDHIIGKLMRKYGISQNREPLPRPEKIKKVTLGNVLTKDYLEEHYVNQKKTTAQIADEVGCSTPSVDYYLKKYDIGNNWLRKRLTNEKLRELYIDKCMTIHEIANIYNCANHTIERFMREYGISGTDRDFLSLSMLGKKFEILVKEMFDILGKGYEYQCREFKGIIPDFYDSNSDIIIDAKISSTTPFARYYNERHFFENYNVCSKVIILYLEGSYVKDRGVFEWVQIDSYYPELIALNRYDMVDKFENLKIDYREELACQ